MTQIRSAAYFGVHLIVAILMSEECSALLQSDSNPHRKVIIHIPLEIKHLTRTVVKVVEKPVVKEYKHDGEIIHHHRHSGYVEHDHSHDIHGPPPPPPPPHEHRMDQEILPAAALNNANSDQRYRYRHHATYGDPATESIISSKARPPTLATQASRLSKYAAYYRTSPLALPLPRRQHFRSDNPNLYRARTQARAPARDSYVRFLFRSSEE